MSGTITVSPTAPWIDNTGIHAPTYQDILAYLISKYQSIYGSDTYLGNDSQDGQWLAVQALAIHDTNSAIVATYNAFSPSTAQGAGLSSVVKINGIKRLIPTNGTVDLTIVGQQGTQINNGIVVDDNNNRWFLPAVVSIPISGQITVTAIAEFSGNIIAPAGSVKTIGTPTRGWQSVTNALSAVPGAPVEVDGVLRQRQSISASLPSVAVLDGIVAAIANIAGVTRVQPYENSTSLIDVNGIPPNTISIVAEGGSAQTIGDTILRKKTPGTGTFGSTSVVSLDANGNPKSINFYRPTPVPITVVIALTPLLGYTSSMGIDAINAVIAALVALPIGEDVARTRMIAAAYSTGATAFVVQDILLARDANAPADTDIVVSFNEAATGDTSTVTLSI